MKQGYAALLLLLIVLIVVPDLTLGGNWFRRNDGEDFDELKKVYGEDVINDMGHEGLEQFGIADDDTEAFWDKVHLEQAEIVSRYFGSGTMISAGVKIATSAKYLKSVFTKLTEPQRKLSGWVSRELEKRMPKLHRKLFPKKPDPPTEPPVDARKKKIEENTEVPDFGKIIGPVDDKCRDKSKWYFRTYDGSCNWLGKGHTDLGSAGQQFGRVSKPHYKPGTFSEPREGPNPREVSNAFFTNNRTVHFPHTPFLVGFVEFIVHELMYSADGTEAYDIPVPKCDPFFDPECTGTAKMPFWRSLHDPTTGKTNPREHINNQTIWIDGSSIYGPNEAWTKKLRAFKDGKMKLDEKGYPPLNDGELPMKARPGKAKNVFALGDWRANQDWLLMSYHIIFLREHNRLCDILKKQNPTWDDERLFQTARVAVGCKFALVGSAYLMSYYTTMAANANPFTVFEQYFGEPVLPLLKYPWKKFIGENGLPLPLPQELDLGYRWHDIVPTWMQLVDKQGNTLPPVSLAETAFDAEGFLKEGLEKVVSGMGVTTIPGFRSGTQDAFRNVKWNLGNPKFTTGFDIVAWAIEHERERGLPTFNEYIRDYDGVVPCHPRKTFEEFSSNPVMVERLKKLYKTPDDVDLAVGQELEEQLWPNMSIPRSAFIISFLRLFAGANMDRFNLVYSISRCFVEGTPFNCKTKNALDDLMWEPAFNPVLFPNGKWLSSFWMKEFDILGKGKNVLRNMIVQNTDIECIQVNPMFTVSDWNPVICSKEPRYDASVPKFDWPFNAK